MDVAIKNAWSLVDNVEYHSKALNLILKLNSSNHGKME